MSNVIRPHPWIMPHRDNPALLDVLAEPVELCARVREFHTSIFNQLGFDPVRGTAAEETIRRFGDEEGPGGRWSNNPTDYDPLYVLTMMGVHVRDYLAAAVNHVAAAGSLVRNGEYLYSVVPVVRASAECSSSVVWLLDRNCTARQFAARVMLDRLASFQQQIKSTSRADDVGARPGLKAMEPTLSHFFFEGEIEKVDGAWARNSALAGQSMPNLEKKWELLGKHYGDGTGYERLYGKLSLFSHPNITHLEFLTGPDSYEVPPEAIRNFLWTGLLMYRDGLRHALQFFGWGEDGAFEEFDSMLQDVYPDAFT